MIRANDNDCNVYIEEYYKLRQQREFALFRKKIAKDEEEIEELKKESFSLTLFMAQLKAELKEKFNQKAKLFKSGKVFFFFLKRNLL